MSSIDERIVQMKFDNNQFESGIKKTLDSLTNLKNSLKFDGAAKGLNDINEASKRLSLQNIADGVQNLSSKFSAMSVVAITALSNITNKAFNAGYNLVKSLTIDPIKTGLEEYETQLNAIQTILSNTQWQNVGLKEVNSALSELNTYADKTIYNFTEMTRNIGTFTAAGVKLETSVSAIKGIANLAAVSGSNSQQASTAMYQLSQALATGTVKLMDWNSVVNAGMGGKVFQDSLKETARVHGVAIDKIIEDEGSFRDSLQKGWLTSEILTETLSKFTGDLNASQLKTMGYTEEQIAGIIKLGKNASDAATKVKTASQLIGTLQEAVGSGWAQTWQLIIGDFDEARTMFTNVSNTLGGFISASADARNAVLSDWKKLGGRTAIINGIANAFNALLDILKPIKEAFRQIFPETTGRQLADASKAFENFTKNLKIGADTADKVKRTFAGVFAVFGIVKEIIKEVVKTFIGLFKTASSGAGSFLDITANIGDFLVSVRNAIVKGEGLSRFFKGLGKVLAVPVKLVQFLSEGISTFINSLRNNEINVFGESISRITDRLKPLNDIGQVIASVWERVTKALGVVWTKVQPLVQNIFKVFSKLGSEIAKAFSDVDYSTALDTINTGLFAGLIVLVRKFINNLGNVDIGGGLLSSIKDSFGALTDTLGAMQANLKANTLLKIAGAVGILTASVVALSLINSEALTKALTAITLMFTELFIAMNIFGNITASASFIKMPFMAASLILLAGAIDVLVLAVAGLSRLDWPGLAKGLVGVGGLLVGLGLFAKFAATSKMGVISGAGIILLAAGIKLLASAVSDFASMNIGDIIKGLASVGAILAELTIFSKFAGNAPAILASGAALVAISISMKIFAKVMKDFARLSWEDIAKGLTAMSGALLSVGVALNLMPPSSLLASGALVAIAGALTILVNVLTNMGGMEWGDIAKALVTLAGSLVIIAAALALMTTALPGAAAVIIVAGALSVLAPVLKTFAGMSWGDIAKGLATLAGVFVVFAAAGLLLTPVTPTLIGLGAAIALLGLGMAAAGVGVLAFSVGLTALAAAGTAGAAAIVGIVGALIGLIPEVMKQIGLGVIAFAKTISTAGPAITKAMTTVIGSLIDAIVILTPKVIAALLSLLTQFLEKLASYTPRLVKAGFKMLTDLLTGIRDNMKPVVDLGLQIIGKFIEGIGAGVPKLVLSGFKAIIDFIDGLAFAIRLNSWQLGRAGAGLAWAIVDGMVDALRGAMSYVVERIRSIAQAMLDAMRSVLGIASPSKKFYEIGNYAGQGLDLGLASMEKSVVKSSEELGSAAINSLRKTISDMSDLASRKVELSPTITPVLDLANIKEGASAIDGLLKTKPIIVTTNSAVSTSAAYSRFNDGPSEPPSSPGIVMKFTQNNTSPKALSSAEIYRQTRNQISKAKGALANVNQP